MQDTNPGYFRRALAEHGRDNTLAMAQNALRSRVEGSGGAFRCSDWPEGSMPFLASPSTGSGELRVYACPDIGMESIVGHVDGQLWCCLYEDPAACVMASPF